MSHFVQFNTKQNRSSFIVLRVKWLIAVFHETNLTKYQKRLNKMTQIKSLLSIPSVSALPPVSIRGHGVKPWPAGGRGSWQEVVSPCQRLVARRQWKLRWPRHRQLPLGRRQVQTAPEDRFQSDILGSSQLRLTCVISDMFLQRSSRVKAGGSGPGGCHGDGSSGWTLHLQTDRVWPGGGDRQRCTDGPGPGRWCGVTSWALLHLHKTLCTIFWHSVNKTTDQ